MIFIRNVQVMNHLTSLPSFILILMFQFLHIPIIISDGERPAPTQRQGKIIATQIFCILYSTLYIQYFE